MSGGHVSSPTSHSLWASAVSSLAMPYHQERVSDQVRQDGDKAGHHPQGLHPPPPHGDRLKPLQVSQHDKTEQHLSEGSISLPVSHSS
jgi:hypothetical protein